MANKLSILVVEHNPIIMRYLCAYLEFHGHTVQSASRVSKAQAILGTSPIDVVIADVYLEGETCYALLKKGEPHPRLVITMSGYDLEAREQRQGQQKGWPHLVKPFATEELEALLRKFDQPTPRTFPLSEEVLRAMRD